MENEPDDDTESGIGGYFRVTFPNYLLKSVIILNGKT